MKRRVAAFVTGVLALAAWIAGCSSQTTLAASPTVQGSWEIVPQTPGPAFRALAAFGAGGVFITTGSDQPGTGIGQWLSEGSDGFGFSYQNFHFAPDGTLSSVTTVNAEGTFQGGTMQGNASQSVAGPNGEVLLAPQSATFTGTRIPVTPPAS